MAETGRLIRRRIVALEDFPECFGVVDRHGYDFIEFGVFRFLLKRRPQAAHGLRENRRAVVAGRNAARAVGHHEEDGDAAGVGGGGAV